MHLAFYKNYLAACSFLYEVVKGIYLITRIYQMFSLLQDFIKNIYLSARYYQRHSSFSKFYKNFSHAFRVMQNSTGSI